MYNRHTAESHWPDLCSCLAHVPHGFPIRFSKDWNPTPPCLRIYQSSKCCQRCHPGGLGVVAGPAEHMGTIGIWSQPLFEETCLLVITFFWENYAKVCIVIVLHLCLILQLLVPTNFKTVPLGLGRWWWHWQTTDVVNNNLTSATANQWPSLKEKNAKKDEWCSMCRVFGYLARKFFKEFWYIANAQSLLFQWRR